MADDEVAVCPECDDASIETRSGRQDPALRGTYRCRACGAAFRDPRYRERRQDTNTDLTGISPQGRALLDLDPSEFP